MLRPVFAALALTLVIAAPGAAQSARSSGAGERHWEIDVSGGAAGSGAGALTATGSNVQDGPSFTAPGSLAQLDRSVSSWWFGTSGSTFLMPSIQSIAPTVRAPGVSARTRGAAGGHATLWLSRHTGFELSAGYAAGAPTQLSGATLSAIDAARASFATAFSSLFDRNPGTIGSPSVSAMSTTTSPAAGRFDLAASMVLSAGTGRTQPYVSAGLAERVAVGAAETLKLVGAYSFVGPGGVPINQSDVVTMRYSGGHSAAVIVGGGVRRFVTARGGVRIDVRGAWGHANDQLALDVAPASAPGTPAGFVVLNTPQSIGTMVFSNTPTQQSTLGGPGASNLVTAAGARWLWTWSTTVGWFWRF